MLLDLREALMQDRRGGRLGSGLARWLDKMRCGRGAYDDIGHDE